MVNPKKRLNKSPITNDAKNSRLSFAQEDLMLFVDGRLEKQFELITTKIIESENRIVSEMNEKINVIESKINIVETRLLNELDKRVCDVMSEIHTVNEKVIELETGCTEIKLLKNEIKTLKTQIQRQENLAVSCDLRLNGIPYNKDENLHVHFENICKALNISTPGYKSIYRLQNKNNKEQNSPDAVIIVKLLSPYDKNFVLKSLALFRKSFKTQLRLQHIGYNNNNCKVYINENLTSKNFKIFRTAMDLVKKNRLASAFTLRGLVYIKANTNDQPNRIEDIRELEMFFPTADDNYQNNNNQNINNENSNNENSNIEDATLCQE